MSKSHILPFTYVETSAISYQTMLEVVQSKNVFDHIASMRMATQKQYATVYASLALSHDVQMFNEVAMLVEQKKKLQPTVLIVIGIGGSALGAKAIHQAIKGRFYHASNPILRVYFLQTIDSDRLATLLAVIEQECKKENNVLVNVVTKSGTTTETIVNFEVVLALLKKYRPHDYHDLVVVTSDSNSPLHLLAQKENFSFLPIPALVGGRYSVFSAVGLFPLMIAGIDCKELLRGARDMLDVSLECDLATNSALQSALLLYLHYKQGITIYDMFLFSVDLETLGKWYRQLLGESIGKEFDIHGNRVCTGITPTVSLGTIDLHSVAQLYLGGPKDKYTTFVAVGGGTQTITIPDVGLSGLAHAQLADVMNAFLQGTQRAYQNNGRPFSTLLLPEKNEYYLGQYMQHKMVEMMLLGYLLEVDPFDQPNVELYKREVRALLKG